MNAHLTAREAAEILDLSRQRVDQLVAEGRIRVVARESDRPGEARRLLSRIDVLRLKRERQRADRYGANR